MIRLKFLSSYKLQLAVSLILTWLCFINFFIGTFIFLPAAFTHLFFLFAQGIGIQRIAKMTGFRQKWSWKLSYLGLFMYQIGFLFKLQHWFYGAQFLILSYLFLMVLYSWRFMKKSEKEVFDYVKWIWLILVIVQDYFWMQRHAWLLFSFLTIGVFTGLILAYWKADESNNLEQEIESIGRSLEDQNVRITK